MEWKDDKKRYESDTKARDRARQPQLDSAAMIVKQ